MKKLTTKRSKNTSKKDNRAYWLNKAWPGPVSIAFAHDEDCWNYLLRTRYDLPPETYPSQDGLCTTFVKGDEIDCIVTINKTDNLQQLVGIVSHEATHCYQKIRDWMKEEKPGIEFEAYVICAITQGLFNCYTKTRGVPKIA